VPDWRDEVCQALDFWIAAEGGPGRGPRMSCIGRARQSSEPGWYDIDARGDGINMDQAESFCLSGQGGPAAGPSYTVIDSVQDGPLIRVRVAEFVKLADAYLWQNKQPATYLVTRLRDGIAGLADPGLAHYLAVGRLASPTAGVPLVAGFTQMQQEAYASCLGTGVRLVWGPPGTGKTRVLSEAISALLSSGRRVLLVSATNIAVDNALLGVISHQRHRPGQLLRCGPPHHPGVLKHPEVCLPNLVGEELANVEHRRSRIEARLLEVTRASTELALIQERLGAFDEAAYARADELIKIRAAIPGLAATAARAVAELESCRQQANVPHAELAGAEERLRQLGPARALYAQADQIQQDVAKLQVAADEVSARALVAENAADRTAANLEARGSGGFFAQVASQSRTRQLRGELDTQRQMAAELAERSREAKDLVGRRRSAAEGEVRTLLAAAEYGRGDIASADGAHAAAERASVHADKVVEEAEQALSGAQQALLAAEARPEPTAAQRALVADAERYDLPALAARAAELRPQVRAAAGEQARLEEEYAEVQQEHDRLRKGAEAVVIRRAQVVATTLARLRTTSALMEGRYDVVLVDEAGAANLAEILLAVSLGKRAAVLFGDFLQLGAILPRKVERAERPDVRRWLVRDVFAHCGITSPAEAEGHPGCTVLNVQHRFGPEIMGLANAVAYDDLLKPGPNVHPHTDDDPEIVLVDVDGLGEIARIRAVGLHSGWWPAGALLSRVLASYHQARGELTGVVTPYRPQVEAILEALRDQEPTAPITDVGTVHRFQGRQFPIVVFDLAEDEYQRRWMAEATRRGTNYRREGVRLFTVAVTRAQTRLYLIGSGRQIAAAPDGTPLAQIASMLRNGRAQAVSATKLITPTPLTEVEPLLGPFGSELSEVLAEQVRVADIHDERSFYDVFAEYLNVARRSIWIWSPWAAKRMWQLHQVLAGAVDRGVKVTLFVRDPSDSVQGRPEQQHCLAELRALVNVVEVNVMHQKIVVVDENVVLLGSLNTLSQRRSREVMLVMRGTHFARKLLAHEHAAEFASPAQMRRLPRQQGRPSPPDYTKARRQRLVLALL